MKKFELLKIGDSVEIENPDEFLKEFLKEKIFNYLNIAYNNSVKSKYREIYD